MPEQSEYAFELVAGRIEKATKESAAFDLFYVGNAPIMIGDTPIAIPTGVRTRFSPTLVAFIKEKSGLALKGLEIKGGVIDADYRDEWKVIARCPLQLQSEEHTELGTPTGVFTNTAVPGWKPYKLEPGDKIAQFVMLLLPDVHFYALPSATISFKDKERTGGFGSTDVPKAS